MFVRSLLEPCPAGLLRRADERRNNSHSVGCLGWLLPATLRLRTRPKGVGAPFTLCLLLSPIQIAVRHLAMDEEEVLLLRRSEISDDDDECIAASSSSFGSECKRVLALAIPVTTSEVLAFLAYLISTAQVGRIGSVELSAITLGRSIFHITGLSLCVHAGTPCPMPTMHHAPCPLPSADQRACHVCVCDTVTATLHIGALRTPCMLLLLCAFVNVMTLYFFSPSAHEGAVGHDSALHRRVPLFVWSQIITPGAWGDLSSPMVPSPLAFPTFHPLQHHGHGQRRGHSGRPGLRCGTIPAGGRHHAAGRTADAGNDGPHPPRLDAAALRHGRARWEG